MRHSPSNAAMGLHIGWPSESNLEKMSWVSSALSPRPSRACGRIPTPWKTFPAISRTRKPPHSSGSIPASWISFPTPVATRNSPAASRPGRAAPTPSQGRCRRRQYRLTWLSTAKAFLRCRSPAASPTTTRRSMASIATRGAATSRSTRTATSSMAPVTICKACRSIRPRAIRAAACRRFCDSRTTSCRRRRPPRSTTAPTLRATR